MFAFSGTTSAQPFALIGPWSPFINPVDMLSFIRLRGPIPPVLRPKPLRVAVLMRPQRSRLSMVPRFDPARIEARPNSAIQTQTTQATEACCAQVAVRFESLVFAKRGVASQTLSYNTLLLRTFWGQLGSCNCLSSALRVSKRNGPFPRDAL